MTTTHSAVLANAGAVMLVMPVLAPAATTPARALTVVLQASPTFRRAPDGGFRASRDGALDAAAELLAAWRPTRIAVDTGLRASLAGDAAQLASLVASRLGHRRLWNASVRRELDEPGLFRPSPMGDVDAGLAAEWYARHIILSTESEAEADDRLLVVTVADDGPLLRAMRTPPRRRTTQPVRPRARISRARRAIA